MLSASGKFAIISQSKEIFKKTDIGGESLDICEELAVSSGHTKSFFSKIFWRFFKTGW